MDCYFANKKVKYCVILGIGDPRPDMSHYPLEGIPRAVRHEDILYPGLS